MKFLIVGRTGSGKDYLAEQLSKRGYKILKSYTTRERRTSNEDTHIFINKDEAIKYKDRIAETKIGDIEYFATKQQLLDNDIYVIDPKGLYVLLNKMPKEKFVIIYVSSLTQSRIDRAIERVKDSETYNDAIYKITIRDKAENEQFTEFENVLNKHISINSRGLLTGYLDLTKFNDYKVYVYPNSYSATYCKNWISSFLSDLDLIE
jgi:dephospho-CoA kinase